MSKIDERLKPYKEELKTAMCEVFKELLLNHADELEIYNNENEGRIFTDPNKFREEATKIVEEEGGLLDLNDWVKEALNEIKMGDLIYGIAEEF